MRLLRFLLALLLFPLPAVASGVLTIGLQLEPPVLDPTAAASGAIAEVLFPTVYEGLVRIGPGWQLSPGLATFWEVAPDGLSYTFHLHPGVRFHDGTPFDASAVKFSLERAAAPASPNPQHADFACISQVDTPDPLTAIVRLSRPCSGLLDALGLPGGVIVSPRSAATDVVNPIGTGPFRFGSWARGDSITLLRNPDYWGTPAKSPVVKFRFIADPNAALDAVLSGGVDVYSAFPAPEAVARLEQNPGLKVDTALSEGKVILAINNRRAPFNNVLVRRALSYGIDRQAVIDAAMDGFGAPIGSHYARQDPGYVDLTGEYPYDPAKARALLAQAGYPHGFSTTIALPPVSYATRAGQVIAAQLAAIGVQAKLVQLDWVPWLTQVFGAHDFDLTIVNHVEPLDYGIYANPDYYFGYNNPRYAALLAQLDATQDPAVQIELRQALQKTLADDAVNVFLLQFPDITVQSARVSLDWAPGPVQDFDLATAAVPGDEGAGHVAAGARYLALGGGVLALALAGGLVLRAGLGYALRRAAGLLATLLVASLIIFTTMQMIPGDPARAILGIQASPAAVAALHARLGLDAPFWWRYAHWLVGLSQGDLGTSFAYHQQVAVLVAQRLALSLPLTLYALLLSTVLALALGLAATYWRGRWGGALATGLARLALAVPNFWFGLMLVIPFGIVLRWVPAGGFPGWGAGLWPALRALTLPAIALALPQAAVLARVLALELRELSGQDFLRTAAAKGAGPLRILLRHALPNALVPLLTILGMQFSFLLAGGVLIENVFFLPGLGRLIIQAIASRDAPVVQSVSLLLVAQVVVVTLLADLAAAAANPRRRTGASQ